MLIEYPDPFPGYPINENCLLMILSFAQDARADAVRLSFGGREIKMQYLIEGRWSHQKGPPGKLWSSIVDGAMSLSQFAGELSKDSCAEIETAALKDKWSFHSSDVNRELEFIKIRDVDNVRLSSELPPTNDSAF